jgi:predicted DNA-binding protein
MEDQVTLSSIRISKILADKLEYLTKLKGITKNEIIRRALEQYFAEEMEPIPQSAQEILDNLYSTEGDRPKIKAKPKAIFNELYKEDDL